jgi:hypothetical protein
MMESGGGQSAPLHDGSSDSQVRRAKVILFQGFFLFIDRYLCTVFAYTQSHFFFCFVGAVCESQGKAVIE